MRPPDCIKHGIKKNAIIHHSFTSVLSKPVSFHLVAIRLYLVYCICRPIIDFWSRPKTTSIGFVAYFSISRLRSFLGGGGGFYVVLRIISITLSAVVKFCSEMKFVSEYAILSVVF